jgi:hypothetical protein
MQRSSAAVKSPGQRDKLTEASLKRWRSRLKRAFTMVEKLERKLDRERKRAARPVSPAVAPARNDVPQTVAATVSAGCDDGLDIPIYLDRNRKLQALPDPKTKERKAQRREVEKQKRQAEITGKRRKMPLTDKAALEAINNGE